MTGLVDLNARQLDVIGVARSWRSTAGWQAVETRTAAAKNALVSGLGHGFRKLRNYRLVLHLGGFAKQDQPAPRLPEAHSPQSGVDP